MTRNERQRLLDLPEIMELGELAAYRKLAQVIGIQFHGEPDKERQNDQK